jgi:hypothetical protein
VTVRPIRIAALSLVVLAAILQLSFGSRTPLFRVANAAILFVALYVLWRILAGRRA